MKIKIIISFIVLFYLNACMSTNTNTSNRFSTSSRAINPVRITHITYQNAYPDIMMYAMSLVGTPYVYGGSNRTTGFDCSGLVWNVYQNTVYTSLPRTAKDMADAGIPISLSQAKVGDLVFFNTNGQKFSHVGIYLGKKRFLHSPNSHSVVQIGTLDNSYWQKQFTGARTYFVK